jgi:hypothetical protein
MGVRECPHMAPGFILNVEEVARLHGMECFEQQTHADEYGDREPSHREMTALDEISRHAYLQTLFIRQGFLLRDYSATLT